MSGVFESKPTSEPWDWVPQETAEALAELGDLVELLQRRHEGLAGLLEGDFLPLRSSVWSSEAASQAAVQTLTPQLTENLRKVSPLPLLATYFVVQGVRILLHLEPSGLVYIIFPPLLPPPMSFPSRPPPLLPSSAVERRPIPRQLLITCSVIICLIHYAFFPPP